MSANTKEVKQRLASIKNTRKITKAMELVAAAKMRKAVENAQTTRAYHRIAWGIVDRLLSSQLWFDSDSPVKRFFEQRADVGHETIIVFTSNRGLAGAFNANVIKQVASYIKNQGKAGTEIIAIGTKGSTTLSALGATVALAYPKNDTAADDSSVREVVDHAYYAFKNGKTDQVLVAYTDYQSAMSQRAVLKQLYPFKRPPEVGLIERNSHSAADAAETLEKTSLEYVYEPNKYDLLDYLARRLAQAELYQCLLESNASEHASRMVAMKNASDAANDMVDDLLLEYNKTRQAAITKEIAEISAGATAVS